ncbi:MAG: glycosyltransferase [Pseudomonadota bacterium]
MKFLVFTTLYPNAAMPTHGVFVENRLRAYVKKYRADIKIIAPVPWFPFTHDRFGRYASWARAPEMEIRHDIEVYHPRYFIPPRIGMEYAPSALAKCFEKAARELINSGWDFDFIDAHYFYPDGVAAAQVAGDLDKPFVITARGTDINLIPSHAGPRAKILDAAMRADAIITVSDGLKDQLVRLGAPTRKITTLRNGVDLDIFYPMDRDKIRQNMQLHGPVIASVGHLIDRKGHNIVIDALKDISRATLLIAGDGEKREALKKQARAAGVDERVRFLGAVPHENLVAIYNAADVLALASSREGWPNVLLEAMACGAPCVTTFAGGGAVVKGLSAGRIVEERTPQAFASAIKGILDNPRDRAATRRYAEDYSWDETIDGMGVIFTGLAKKAAASRSVTSQPLKIQNTDRPKLIVTVDTEEQFDWSSFEQTNYTICDPNDLKPFQRLCAERNVKPLYFLTYPLLKDEKVSAYFRTLFDSGQADTGLHLHQWVTPPNTSFTGEYFSFQKNLPSELHADKLAMLATAFESAFGERALSHRAGRYGIVREGYQLLSDIGVSMDFSPSVAFDFSSAGGPDFSGYANQPFSASGKKGKVFVTPVSGAKAIRGTRLFRSRAGYKPGFARSVQERLGAQLQPMRLSPEGTTLKDLQALTKRLVADGSSILTFTLHSTSLTPGANDYARSQNDVDRTLEITRRYLDWFQQSANGVLVSLAELSELYKTEGRTRV